MGLIIASGRAVNDRLTTHNVRKGEPVMSKDKPKEKCWQCGFKIRGENHDKGEHHLQGKNGKHEPKVY